MIALILPIVIFTVIVGMLIGEFKNNRKFKNR